MQKFENQHYIINYLQELEEFIFKAVKNAEERKDVFEDLFEIDWDLLPKIRASYFISRDEFLKYLKDSFDFVPGPNAIGCFCNGEIQALVDIETMYQYNTLFTLAHETVHLFIQELYKQFNIERLRWFDEAYAYYLERPREGKYQKYYHEKALILKDVAKGFDVNILDDRTKLTTEKYRGFDIFQVIGKYIFDNNLQKEYLNLLRINPQELGNVGKDILQNSVEYILSIDQEQ